MLPVFLVTGFCCKTSEIHVNIVGPPRNVVCAVFIFTRVACAAVYVYGEALLSRVAHLLRVVVLDGILLRCIFYFWVLLCSLRPLRFPLIWGLSLNRRNA